MLTEIENKQLKRGLLIAFEGIDGAGKTTQAKILLDRLAESGYTVVLLHEPTDGKWGRKIAELAKYGRDKIDAKMEFEFFHFDRIEDVRKNIKPSLKKKKIVIMDRYYLSSVAYQGARNLDPKFIEEKSEEIAPRPNVAIILDLPAETALSRIRKKRNSEPNHFERAKYLEKVRSLFLMIYKTRPYVKIIKGDDTSSIDDIASEIWRIIEPIVHAEEV